MGALGAYDPTGVPSCTTLSGAAWRALCVSQERRQGACELHSVLVCQYVNIPKASCGAGHVYCT